MRCMRFNVLKTNDTRVLLTYLGATSIIKRKYVNSIAKAVNPIMMDSFSVVILRFWLQFWKLVQFMTQPLKKMLAVIAVLSNCEVICLRGL